MIGSFWNLCRACPSMPVDKLHSEYRSTYRWHEYKKNAPLPGGVVQVLRQPATAPNPLPQAREPIEPVMPRRKKYPGVAYKSNDLFDSSLVAATEHHAKFKLNGTLDRARSVQRNEGRAGAGAGRRSKSEGRQRPLSDVIDAKPPPPPMGTDNNATMFSSEYRNQFKAYSKDAVDAAGQPRKSISMGTLKLAAQQSIKRKPAGHEAPESEPLMNHIDENSVETKVKNEVKMNGHIAPRRSAFRSALTAIINVANGKDNQKRYKSEYKKKFRPFSQYVYQASKGTFTKCRGDKVDEADGSREAMLPEAKAAVGDDKPDASVKLSDSWYREVLDLRKRAGEYKYRGWGTELAPEHLTQLYNKQIELWYQVSRRSSLSALALANTNHRALMKDDRDKDIDKNRSPKKLRSSLRSTPHSKFQDRSSDRSPHKTSPQKVVKKMHQHSFDEAALENARANELRRPRSADPRPITRQPLHKSGGSQLSNKVKTNNQSKTQALPTKRSASVKRNAENRNAENRAADRSVENRKAENRKPENLTLNRPANSRRSRSASNVGIKLDDVPPPRFDTPVVKSPPEPTRVKSPEQLNMRSPDPVNWTVPLDTAKTFTVTQNVKTEIAPTHQLSPKRTLKLSKSESPTNQQRNAPKTPTPSNLTPIDETKPLTVEKPIANGHVKEDKSPTSECSDKKLFDGSVEMAQTKAEAKGNGSVDTCIVNSDSARNSFNKFWGKKEENDQV